MRRNTAVEVSTLVIVVAFIAGLLTYEPFTNLLVSSKQYVNDYVSSSYDIQDNRDGQVVSLT